MPDRPDRPFDTTLRQLVRADPRAWLALAGWPTMAAVELLDTNVSALRAEVDAAIRVDDPSPWVAHLEFQSSYDPDLPDRVDHYSFLLGREHRVPILSSVILLRPAADGPALRARVEHRRPDGTVYRWFEYGVVRLWERPLCELLEGSLALVPLAPVVELFGPARDEGERLRRTGDVIHRLGERIRREASPDQVPLLWAESYFVLGLRYPRETAGRLLQGVRGMRDSLTYQAVLEEGRAEGEARGRVEGEARGRLEEARRLLRQLGERRFGPPDPAVIAALASLTDLERVERVTLRLLDAASWEDALAN